MSDLSLFEFLKEELKFEIGCRTNAWEELACQSQ